MQAVLADAGRRELPEELLQALESAPLVPEHEIDRWIEAHRQMPRTGRDKRPPRSRIKPEDITDQQFRALELAATGLTQKEVALAMGIDRETVRNHISRGCYRLGAKNTTHAVAIAIRKGLI